MFRNTNRESKCMKWLLVAAVVLAVAAPGQAGIIYKADNTDDLSGGSSWVGGVAPGASDVATWDSTVTAANASPQSASVSWAGIAVTNPGGPVTTNGWGYGYNINLGASGIDMSAATQNLTVNSGVSLTADQSWTVAAGRTLTIAAAANGQQFQINGKKLTVGGDGDIVLNSWSGTQNGSTLTKTGSGTLTVNGDLRLYYSDFNIQGGVVKAQSKELYDGSYWSGGGAIKISGGGTLELQNWQYGTYMNLGALRADADAIVLNNGTIRMTGTDSPYQRGFTINSGGATLEAASGVNWSLPGDVPVVVNGNGNLTLAGAGTGSFGKVFYGGGSLTKNGTGTWTLTAANTHTGNTIINGGVLAIANNSALGNSSQVYINTGGTLQTTAAMTLASSRAVFVGPAAGINVSSGTLGIPGTVGNGGDATSGLVKSGTGALVLSGNNSYTGPTAVNAGSLCLNGSNATSAISVNAGATLGGLGSASLATATIAAGGILEAGSGGSGSLGLNGLTLSGSNTVNIFNITAYTTNAAIGVTGSNLFTLSGDAGSTVIALEGTVPVGSGVAHLFQYAGSLQGTGLSALTLNTSGMIGLGRAVLSLSSANAGYIDLNYAIDRTLWTGAGDGSWTTAAQSPKNWALEVHGTPVDFQAGDTVVFSDAATGTLTVTVSAANVAPSTMIVSNTASNYTFQGPCGITGGAQLYKSGPGSLTLANSNSFTGGTTLNDGVLNLNHAAALGSGALTVNGGTLDNTSGAPITLSGNNAQNWNSDVVFLGSSPLNTGTGAVTLDGSRQVTVTGTGALTIGGAISGSGLGLTKAGEGTLILTGANTYTGPTTVGGGTLQIGDGGPSGVPGSGGLTVNGGVLAFHRSDSSSFGGAVTAGASGGTIAQQAAAGLTLTGAPTLNGNLTLLAAAGGTLNIGAYTDSNEIIFNNNTLTVGGDGTTVLNSWGASQSGTLIKTGSGLLTVTGQPRIHDGNVTISGGTLSVQNNSFYSWEDSTAGAITVQSGGVLQLQNWQYGEFYNLGCLRVDADAIVLNNGTIRMTGVDSEVRGFTINSGGATLEAASGANWLLPGDVPIVVNGDGNLTLAGAGTGSFGKVFYGGGSLTKNGTGTWSLAGVNTYSGGTTVNAGTLNINADAALGNPAGGVTFSGNSTLQAVADGIVLNSTRGLMINNGVTATIDTSGNNTTIAGSIGGSGGLTKAGAGTLILSGSNTYSGGTFVENGTLILTTASALADGTSLTIGAGATLLYDPSYTAGTIQGLSLSPVPEPSTLALLAAGLVVGFGVWRRKK